jgi:curli biogenesis system outer membrane secretion channel CsgG
MNNAASTTTHQPKRLAAAFLLGLAGLTLGACRQVDTGEGGSIVTGSAGPKGNVGENRSLAKCEAPVATVAVVESPRGYMHTGKYPNLPESPVPLIRLMLQQSGCFRVVDRYLGLDATRSEMDLAKEGLTRPDMQLQKQQVLVAQYTITPNLVFSEENAGDFIGGIMSVIPGLEKYSGMASKVKFKEAQVTLFLTDNQTTEQLGASEGAARATDLGAGGFVLGKLGGAGAAGWGNTNEGKIIAAAFLDATNKLVPHVRTIAAKQLPPPVATSNVPLSKAAAPPKVVQK